MVDLQDMLKMKLKDTMLNSESELKIDSVLQNNSVSEILIFSLNYSKLMQPIHIDILCIIWPLCMNKIKLVWYAFVLLLIAVFCND